MSCELRDKSVQALLREVRRPGRYLGGRINFPRKADGELKFLLCFPDLYDIGMSNLGLRILYHVLNRHPHIVADLAFAPWVDMEAFMRRRRMPLRGLGLHLPAGDFDIVGFSLQHELQYTNVLNMLDLAGISLRSEARRPGDPIVVAGGPCAFNPEPMSEFIDAFALGDGESVCLEISETVLQGKSRDSGRSKILEDLAGVEGVYVPLVADQAGRTKIKRRAEPVLREEDFPLPPIVSLTPITHDRLTLEVMRGCTRGCRFCSAGMLTRPVRWREAASAARLAERGIDQSGWEEVSLISLSTSDYPDLEELIGRLNLSLAGRQVSISLPSMRPGTFSEEIARMVGSTKRTGLTFAPEAGSPGLRRSLNKDIDQEDLYATVETAFRHGWDAVKLYFMIGLPGETDADIEDLITMVRCVESICRAYGRRKRITVSLSPFVPRPHTPFQWRGQADPRTVLERISIIRKKLPHGRIKIKWRDPYMAELEGILARGDRGLAKVVLEAWKSGSRFDGWTDRFDFSLWRACLEAAGAPWQDLLAERDPQQPLAWGFIDGGVSAAFLLEEARRADRGDLTPDCRTAGCNGCGACVGRQEAPVSTLTAHGPAESAPPERRQGGAPDVRIRYRVRYAKGGWMRVTSHLDVIRCMQRGLRRAGLPVCFSAGHSPHPRLSFGPPLPLGVAGNSEYFDVLFNREPPADWQGRLNGFLPDGLKVLQSLLVPLKGPSLMQLINAAFYSIEIWCQGRQARDRLLKRINQALVRESAIFGFQYEVQDDKIILKLQTMLAPGGERLEKVVEAMLEGSETYLRTTREGLYHRVNGQLRSPLSPGTQEG